MEIVVAIFKQLPPFWPRLVLLIVLVLLVALPQTRRLFARRPKRLQRAKDLLAIRKLELEVAGLRATHHVEESALDQEIRAIIDREHEKDEEEPPLPWTDRLKLAGAGGLAFLVLGILAAGLSGRQAGMGLAVLALKELLVIVPCAGIASAIPARNRWGPVFYGFLVPMLLAALVVAARMRN